MRRFGGPGTKRPVPPSALAEELHQVALGGGPQAFAVLPGQSGQALPFGQPAMGHSGKRRAVMTPPPAKGGRVEVIDLTQLDSDDEGGAGQGRPGAHEQQDGIEQQEEEEEAEEEGEDSYVYHYDSDASDGEAAGGSFAHRAPPPHSSNSLGHRIASSFAGAASDLPDLHPLELHFSPSHSPHFTLTLHLDGVPYNIKCIPCLSEPSRLDRAVVSTTDPAAPFPGFMTRLLGAFLPHVMEAADEGALRTRIGECMNALYVESVRMLKTEKASTASSEQQAVDCERILSLLGPLVRYQNPALRLLHASTFLMRHYERFCYVCGRVHDLPAEVETQEALLCARARESDVRVTSVVRVHVCGAELCAHTATEALGLMAPAMETRINGGTVTEFLLDAVSNAGRSGKMDLFSYVPPDYIKPGKQDKGAGRGDIDGAKLLAGVCDLRRLTYAKMKECIDAQPKDDEDPGPEGLERRFRGLFDTLFTDSRDPAKPERIYKLYWWLCVCYKSHLREVPLSYVTDYFTKIRPLSEAHQPQLGVMLQQVQESCASRHMVVLEMVNDRRPKRRTFEATRQSILSSGKGTSWIAFHGSRSENWHSLLQTGVQVLSNTPHMLNGAAYGKGVYTSNTFSVSLGYSLGVGLSSSTTNMDAPPVGIVEVACDASLTPANIRALPDGDGVCLKFIVVKKHQPAQGGGEN